MMHIFCIRQFISLFQVGTDKNTKTPQKFGHIIYDSEAAAEKAITLMNGKKVGAKNWLNLFNFVKFCIISLCIAVLQEDPYGFTRS